MGPAFWTLVFLTATALALFAALTVRDARARGRLRERLRRIVLAAPDDHGPESTIVRELRGEPTGPMGRLARRFRLLEPLRLLLYRAGQPFTAGRFLVLSAALGAAGFTVGNVLLRDPRMGVALAGVGIVPLLMVHARKRARMRQFEAMLPQALDLLSRALRAGHAMSAGLQMVGEEMDEPVGPEFAQVAEEVQFGLELPLALSNLQHRIDVPDIPFFVTALIIQRETGGNLAEVIDGLGKVIRDRLATQGKIRALTAQSRWSANILLGAPFVFAGAMSLFRRDYVAPLWETPAGNVIAVAAFCMAIVGWALCRRVGVVKV